MTTKTKKTVAEKEIAPTKERLKRAKEAGQKVEKTQDKQDKMLRITDPFDVMRSTRTLAPHDPRLNDIRWLVGEALRRLYIRAQLDVLRSVSLERIRDNAYGPRSGLPASEAALQARDKLRLVQERVGPAAWPVMSRVIIEGSGVRECRNLVPEIVTPWRADAVVTDRLRVGLDMIAELMGVVACSSRKGV